LASLAPLPAGLVPLALLVPLLVQLALMSALARLMPLM